MQALECLVGEEAQPGIGDDPQHGGREAMVEGLQPLLPGDADENVKNVAVPARRSDGGQAEAAAQGGTARLNSLILGASAAGGGQAWMLTLSFFKEHK